jgi:hypothetical protein
MTFIAVVPCGFEIKSDRSLFCVISFSISCFHSPAHFRNFVDNRRCICCLGKNVQLSNAIVYRFHGQNGPTRDPSLACVCLCIRHGLCTRKINFSHRRVNTWNREVSWATMATQILPWKLYVTGWDVVSAKWSSCCKRRMILWNLHVWAGYQRRCDWRSNVAIGISISVRFAKVACCFQY